MVSNSPKTGDPPKRQAHDGLPQDRFGAIGSLDRARFPRNLAHG